MNARSFSKLLILCAVMLATARDSRAENRSDQPASQPSWNQIKSASGKSTSKKPKAIKFQVGSSHWRVNVKSSIDNTGGANTGTIQVALMVEKIRNVEGKAENWTQVGIVCSSQVPAETTQEFDNGFGPDGKPQWLELLVSGNTSTYNITIDDQTAPVEHAKPKKKSKSS